MNNDIQFFNTAFYVKTFIASVIGLIIGGTIGHAFAVSTKPMSMPSEIPMPTNIAAPKIQVVEHTKAKINVVCYEGVLHFAVVVNGEAQISSIYSDRTQPFKRYM